MVAFAKSLETTLSMKIAEARAPGAPVVTLPAPPAATPSSVPTTASGG
jgi:hypothetical protein